MSLVENAWKATTNSQSNGFGAIARAFVLFLPAMFCGFGFCASYELGSLNTFHLGYGAFGAWLVSMVIEQLGNAAPRKHGWVWLLGLSIVCLLIAAVLVGPADLNWDRKFTALMLGIGGKILLAGSLWLALNPRIRLLRLVVKMTLGALAFLIIPFSMCPMATGDIHLPWNPGSQSKNQYQRPIGQPGPARIPAIPARSPNR